MKNNELTIKTQIVVVPAGSLSSPLRSTLFSQVHFFYRNAPLFRTQRTRACRWCVGTDYLLLFVTQMRVLIACEFSGIVRDAFIAAGHDAVSCDLLPTERPGPHIQDNVLNHLDEGWDMMIAHPPCTYLSNAGARHLFPGGVLNKERYEKGLLGKQLFLRLLNCGIPRICVENPIPSTVFNLPRHTQEIHPYHFGHTFKKATRLWLKGLKPLMPTNILFKRVKYVHRGGCSVTNGSVSTAKDRSKTFPGIALAMATQWGKLEPIQKVA